MPSIKIAHKFSGNSPLLGWCPCTNADLNDKRPLVVAFPDGSWILLLCEPWRVVVPVLQVHPHVAVPVQRRSGSAAVTLRHHDEVQNGTRLEVQHPRIPNANEAGLGIHLERRVLVTTTKTVGDPLTSTVCSHSRDLLQMPQCKLQTPLNSLFLVKLTWKVQMIIFCVFTPSRIIILFRHFGGIHCFHLHGDWIWFRCMLKQKFSHPW